MRRHGPGKADILPSLLSILNKKKRGSSITSVISAGTIDLLRNLLYPQDYISVATRLSKSSDVENLLDFILHLLRDRGLTSLNATTDFNRRAKRLMFKIMSTNPVIPPSLIVTKVKVPAKRDYIGGGAFGGVCKGTLRGEIVALKVLYRTGDNVAFCREALMWATLKHQFVLSFLGIYREREEMFLVSPYMENGTLAQWRKNAKLSITETRERMLEVAQGMEYIHSEDIVHGDLRGDNILLDANLHVQIADFGLTRLLDATNTRSGAKHVNFSAPELFGCPEDADNPDAVDPARTQMSDVYAFGSLYYEIYYDSIPFAGRTEGQIMFLVAIQDKRPNRRDEPPLSDRAWEVIQRCWAREPRKRPRMKDVIEDLMGSQRNPTSAAPIPAATLSTKPLFTLRDSAFAPTNDRFHEGGPFVPKFNKSSRMNVTLAGELYESDMHEAEQKRKEKKNVSGWSDSEDEEEADRVLPSPLFGPAGGTLGYGTDFLASSTNFWRGGFGGGGENKETSYTSQMELECNFSQGVEYKDDDVEDDEEPVDSPLPPGAYRALYVFEAFGDAEMGLEEGQIVAVVGKGRGDGWAVVKDTRDGREGRLALVPESYLEPVQLADDSSSSSLFVTPASCPDTAPFNMPLSNPALAPSLASSSPGTAAFSFCEDPPLSLLTSTRPRPLSPAISRARRE